MMNKKTLLDHLEQLSHNYIQTIILEDSKSIAELSDLNEKSIPGLFSTKRVPIGTTTATIVRKGDIKNEKIDTSKMTINDFKILPNYGYPAMVMDETALKNVEIKKLGISDEVSSGKWNVQDFVALKKIFNKKSIKEWNATRLNDFWVIENQIESGRQTDDRVSLYSDRNCNYFISDIAYGFYTKFYTSTEDTSTAMDGHKTVNIRPHNQSTSKHDLIMYFHKLVSEYVVVAVQISDDVILMKIPSSDFTPLYK